MARKYTKKAEATGAQSVLDAEREFKNYNKILEIAMNPDEFEAIWNHPQITPNVKLNFIMNSQKYIFKEKGRETESETNAMNGRLDNLESKTQALTKLLNS